MTSVVATDIRAIAEGWVSPDHLDGRFFSGKWRKAQDVATVRDVASGEELGKVAVASPADVATASRRAADAQRRWFALSYEQRAQIFRDAAAIAQAKRAEIVEWIMRESGSTEAKADYEVAVTIKLLHECAAMPSQSSGQVLPANGGRISMARRRPLGVVGVISPFNFPLYLAIRAVAPALAIGNAVVLKPDLRTAVCGGFVIARLFEEAGLPEDLLHVLPGGADVGAALCTDPHIAMIQFTGSTAAGRKVGELAGGHLKKVSLELGGKNALIILDDADIDLAVKNAKWGSFLHQGQICMAAGRILVHSAIVERFAAALSAATTPVPVGDPATRQVALGPLINDHQLAHATAILSDATDKGAKLLTGGTSDGLFFKPAVLSDVRPAMRAYEEEIFAPVAVLIPFDTDEQAIEIANSGDYGLAGAVITQSIERALAFADRLNVGLLHINDQTVNEEVVNPFGGAGASGNGTSIGGPANWEEFSQWQWLTMQGRPPAYPL